jgi:hypothetical protein
VLLAAPQGLAVALLPLVLHMELVSEDALLKILQLLPELEYWSICELVCRSWCRLLRENRTRIAFCLPKKQQQSPELLSSSSSLLLRALAVAERSRQSLVELSVRCESIETAPCNWTDVELASYEGAVTRAASTLEALRVTGPAGFFPTACGALDAAFSPTVADFHTRRLRVLDLSWTNAVSADAVGSLLESACGADGSLESLRLGGCMSLGGDAVGGVALAFTHGLQAVAPRLRELALPGCFHPSIDLPTSMPLSEFESLTSLNLSGVKFTPRGLRECLSCPQLQRGLRRLSLAGATNLPSRMFAHALIVCEALTAIDFSASLIDDEAIFEAVSNAPRGLAHLSDVCLSECSNIRNVGVEELCEACGASLHSIALGGAFTPLNSALLTTVGEAAALTRLELRGCQFSSQDGASQKWLSLGLDTLVRISPHFEHLDLSHTNTLSPENLGRLLPRSAAVGGCSSRLRVLCLRMCSNGVTDEVLSNFVPRAHSLETLDVAECMALTDMSCIVLSTARARALRGLRVLDIRGCIRMTARGHRRLRQTYPLSVVRMDEEEG